MPKRKVSTAERPVFAIASEDEIRRRPIFKIATTVCLGALFLLILVAKLDRLYGKDYVAFERDDDHKTRVATSHANPTPTLDGYRTLLQEQNIGPGDRSASVGSANSLCAWFGQTGQSFRSGVEHVMKETPNWSQQQATAFVVAATTTFCPGVAK